MAHIRSQSDRTGRGRGKGNSRFDSKNRCIHRQVERKESVNRNTASINKFLRFRAITKRENDLKTENSEICGRAVSINRQAQEWPEESDEQTTLKTQLKDSIYVNMTADMTTIDRGEPEWLTWSLLTNQSKCSIHPRENFRPNTLYRYRSRWSSRDFGTRWRRSKW